MLKFAQSKTTRTNKMVELDLLKLVVDATPSSSKDELF